MTSVINIDLLNIGAEEDFHDSLAEQLKFPLHYGRNKDAFWDCVTEMADPILIRITHFSSLPDDLRSYVSDYIEILHEAELETNGRLRVIVDS